MLALVAAAAILWSSVHYAQSSVIHRCPDDWVNFETYCYAFLDNIAPWSMAVEMCRQLDSSLLVITNQRENNFIAAQLRTRHGTSGVDWYWMNINDFVREGHWVQGDNQPLAFTNWAAREPNNDRSSENGQDCAIIRADGIWDDLWCQEYSRQHHKPRPVCRKSVKTQA